MLITPSDFSAAFRKICKNLKYSKLQKKQKTVHLSRDEACRKLLIHLSRNLCKLHQEEFLSPPQGLSSSRSRHFRTGYPCSCWVLGASRRHACRFAGFIAGSWNDGRSYGLRRGWGRTVERTRLGGNSGLCLGSKTFRHSHRSASNERGLAARRLLVWHSSVWSLLVQRGSAGSLWFISCSLSCAATSSRLCLKESWPSCGGWSHRRAALNWQPCRGLGFGAQSGKGRAIGRGCAWHKTSLNPYSTAERDLHASGLLLWRLWAWRGAFSEVNLPLLLPLGAEAWCGAWERRGRGWHRFIGSEAFHQSVALQCFTDTRVRLCHLLLSLWWVQSLLWLWLTEIRKTGGHPVLLHWCKTHFCS